MNVRRAARLDGPSTVTGAWLRACEPGDALAERVGLAAVLVLERLLAERLPLVVARLRGVLLVLGALGILLRDALAHCVRLVRVRAVERLEGRVAHRLLLLLAQLRGGLLRGCFVRKGDRRKRAEHENRNETDQFAHCVGHLFRSSLSRRFHGGRPTRIPQLARPHRRLTKRERPPNRTGETMFPPSAPFFNCSSERQRGRQSRPL